MNVEVRHFLLTPDGSVREFSADDAASVAAGQSTLPEFADCRLRYVQVAMDQSNGQEIRVQTGVACLQFDAAGRFTGAEAPEGEQLDPFEFDACVQWALNDAGSTELVVH